MVPNPVILTGLIITGVLGLLGLIIWLSVHFEKKRAAQLLESALAMGFESLAVFPTDLDGHVAGSSLMNAGRNRIKTNIFRRRVEPLDVTIYDYQYTTGSGKSQQYYQQTVALFHSPVIQLPRFVIKPENWLSKVGEMFGGQDIDFAETPEFSKKYVLSGDNEPAIREFFTPVRLETLAGYDGLCMEAQPGCLLLWFQRQRVPPGELKEFFEKAFRVYHVLSAAG